MTDRPEDRYTLGHHDSVLRSHRWRTAENSAGYLLPHLRPGQRLLDAGCGPGTITLDLAGRVAPGQAVGVDRVEAPLEEARRAAGQRGTSNVTFEIGDIYDLGYPDGSFDVVHAHQVLQHLGDPVAALAEMRLLADDLTTASELADVADAFRTWAAQPDAWFAVLHGEVLAVIP